MPRFASAFTSFLSLQGFSSRVQSGMPGDAAELTWIDVYMSIVGMLMVFAVIENIYVQYVNEHCSERSAFRIDQASRFVFPVSYILLLIMALAAKNNVNVAYGITHAYLG